VNLNQYAKLVREHEQAQARIRAVEGKIQHASHQIVSWKRLLAVLETQEKNAARDIEDMKEIDSFEGQVCFERCIHTGLLCLRPEAHDGEHVAFWVDGSIVRYTQTGDKC